MLITLFVCGLPRSTTEDSLVELFSEYGTIRSLKLRKDLGSGECKGIALVGMEGREARAAFAGLDGRRLKGTAIRVGLEWPSSQIEG
jgi:RNA recognition motif-containing protein